MVIRKFISVLTHFVLEWNLTLRFSIFWANQKILSNFQKKLWQNFPIRREQFFSMWKNCSRPTEIFFSYAKIVLVWWNIFSVRVEQFFHMKKLFLSDKKNCSIFFHMKKQRKKTYFCHLMNIEKTRTNEKR